MTIASHLHIKGMQQHAELLKRQLAGQRDSDLYIVDMAYQCMATKYDWSSPALSSLMQTMGLFIQGLKECVFIETNGAEPAIPVFDHLSMKEYHFSNGMIEFLVQHLVTLPPANNPLI
jgi:hypothetical protein